MDLPQANSTTPTQNGRVVLFSIHKEETEPDNWLDLAHILETSPEVAHRCVVAAYKSLSHAVPMDARFCMDCEKCPLDEGKDASNPFLAHECEACGEPVGPEGPTASNPLALFSPTLATGDRVALTLPDKLKLQLNPSMHGDPSPPSINMVSD